MPPRPDEGRKGSKKKKVSVGKAAWWGWTVGKGPLGMGRRDKGPVPSLPVMEVTNSS